MFNDIVRQAMEKEASRLERQHVHNVYEKIAPYFNDKRYKAWPKVQEFLLAQEPGSLVADIGCGNGKYLHINSQTYKVGCDYCLPLVEAARNQGYEAMVCDGLRLPYRDGCFDAVLSIAVIHHFSTKERRALAIKEMTRILKVGGQMMIYVWAMEQKRRKFEKQDLLIPWNMQPNTQNLSLSWQTDLKTIPLNQHFNKVHTFTKQRTKSFSILDNQPSPYQNKLQSSKFLAQSLDSGLNETPDSVANEQYNGSIFHRLYNLYIDIKRGRNTNSPKALHFFKTFVDFVPHNVQNHENNSNTVGELLRSPIPNQTLWKSPNVELGKGIIEDLRVVPLPDLGSKYRESIDQKVTFTKNSVEHKTKNQRDNPFISSNNDHEMVSSPVHQLLQGVNNSCLRYYHIFKQGELGDLIEQCIPELRVVKTFFDHSNWCVIAEKIQLSKD
ncbi:probable tRNA methyltransferase 9B [Hyla sarda]|uniref:probable tRNA methyltransferase 9B n=1 Tax=Hyla sarda TaxID=327740 RepID=UPI0024C3FEE2|nr:probable tRNA methyltransferase 9B [Hyla sarda]XP_056417883.1 probable tRNA methyltransferase 9B [Hyla sarda]